MNEETAQQISKKLNVVIALLIKQINGEVDFTSEKAKKGIGDIARFLRDIGGLEANEIAEILGSPVTSIRTLLTPTRRK